MLLNCINDNNNDNQYDVSIFYNLGDKNGIAEYTNVKLVKTQMNNSKDRNYCCEQYEVCNMLTT